MLECIQLALPAHMIEANRAAAKAPLLIGAKNAKDGEPAELILYGEVGNPYENMDAGSVAHFLRANSGVPVVVRINSFGGSAYDGIAIRNALASHNAKTTAIIDGIAGSAASIIAVGAQKVKIMENATYFIHRASLIAGGHEDTLLDGADWLRKIDESIARTYKAKTNVALDKLKEWMYGRAGDGVNFSATEALANKFVDEIVPLKGAHPTKAHWDAIPDADKPLVAKRFGSSAYRASKRVHERQYDGIKL